MYMLHVYQLLLGMLIATLRNGGNYFPLKHQKHSAFLKSDLKNNKLHTNLVEIIWLYTFVANKK